MKFSQNDFQRLIAAASVGSQRALTLLDRWAEGLSREVTIEPPSHADAGCVDGQRADNQSVTGRAG
jgi:hypothetical protein